MKCSDCKTMPNLRHRIAFWKPSEDATAGPSGHVDLASDANWTLVFYRRSELKAGPGGEVQVANRTEGRVVHQFTVMFDSHTRTIAPTWRIEWDSKQFNIEAAYDPDGTRWIVRIRAIEVQ